MPSHAHLMVEDNEQTYAGMVLAKIPRETTKPKDSRAIFTPRRRNRAVGTPSAAPALGAERGERPPRAESVWRGAGRRIE